MLTSEGKGKLYSQPDAATYLGMTVQRLHQLCGVQLGPPRYRVGRYWFYCEHDLDKWKQERGEVRRGPKKDPDKFRKKWSGLL